MLQIFCTSSIMLCSRAAEEAVKFRLCVCVCVCVSERYGGKEIERYDISSGSSWVQATKF